MLLRAAPAFVHLADSRSFLVVVGGRGNHVNLLTPDRHVKPIALVTVQAAMLRPFEGSSSVDVDALLHGVRVSPAQRERVAELLGHGALSGDKITGCFLLRVPPEASFVAQSKVERLPARAISLLIAHGLQLALGVGSWALLGRGALSGRLERSWLLGWACLLVTLVPVRLLCLWLQGELAVAFGQLLKRRLLTGSLRLDPTLLRKE
jgi:ATP-binding cassette subfamily B protein